MPETESILRYPNPESVQPTCTTLLHLFPIRSSTCMGWTAATGGPVVVVADLSTAAAEAVVRGAIQLGRPHKRIETKKENLKIEDR